MKTFSFSARTLSLSLSYSLVQFEFDKLTEEMSCTWLRVTQHVLGSPERFVENMIAFSPRFDNVEKTPYSRQNYVFHIYNGFFFWFLLSILNASSLLLCVINSLLDNK